MIALTAILAAIPPTTTPIIDPTPGRIADPIKKPQTLPTDEPSSPLTLATAPITCRFLNSSFVILPFFNYL